MNLEIYQKLCSESKILWTQHCLQRMQERDISRADVKNGIATGEIIEDYLKIILIKLPDFWI